MVEEQRCPTPAIFYFFLKNSESKKKDAGAKTQVGGREVTGWEKR